MHNEMEQILERAINISVVVVDPGLNAGFCINVLVEAVKSGGVR